MVLSVSDEDLLEALKRDVICSSINYVQVGCGTIQDPKTLGD